MWSFAGHPPYNIKRGYIPYENRPEKHRFYTKATRNHKTVLDVMKENGITVIFKENSPLYAVLPFDKFSEISDKADSAAK